MWDIVFAYWMIIPFYLLLKYDRPHLFTFETYFGRYGFFITFILILVVIMHIKVMISAFASPF